ncbi:MAG: ribbon-helix-helix domain-containing protein [Niveispirillum sp.]|uniref:ribbon-helix-helix domain-containing protein n=1 Tax=Niveispirillum sp. TaxID=1917217 RepID=UPI003BA611A9
MANNTIRWHLTGSAQTDATVRRFLAERGDTECSLSSFVEEAVKSQLAVISAEPPRPFVAFMESLYSPDIDLDISRD